MGTTSAKTMGNYLTVANLSSFVFCIFLVSYMYVLITNRNNSHSRYTFKKLIILSIACLCADMLTYIFDTRVFFGARLLNAAATSLNAFLTVCLGCLWNHFFDVALHIQLEKRKKFLLYIIPPFVAAVSLICNLFTGFMFTIDESNVYTRGSFAWLNFFLQYVLLGMLFLRAVLFKISTKTKGPSRYITSFVWLSSVALFFGVFQMLGLGKIAFHCYAVTASIFIMFLRFQNNQITNDLLTGLNNRYALDVHAEDKIKIYHDGMHGRAHLYLIMMDVNDFKRINDIYGHVEGDNALKTVSKILKRIGASYGEKLFLARFGGDEFSAVFETNSERKVVEICNNIKSELKKETENNKYRLMISAGYAEYSGSTMSLVELYETADKALYEDKKIMKNE